MEQYYEVTDKMMIDNYTTFFFDLFHTLTYPGILEEDAREWHIFGVSREDWIEYSISTYPDRGLGRVRDFKKILETIVLATGADYDEDRLKFALEIRINKFRQCLEKVPGNILSALQSLVDAGKKLCLISNADCIDKNGWDSSPLKDLFHYAIFSCDVGLLKPDREIYSLGLRAMNCEGRDAVYIGDGGSSELEGARGMGMTTVLTKEFIISLWPEKIPELREYADYEIDSLNELLEL